ncbi:MAG: magnesium/cobalt transporter CorA [Gammaproteobacteria bacterium]|nr:magnesium/cobalt transporter CorA [Gammaproteobacteria bacterium]
MSDSLDNTYQKAGLPPGSLVHVGVHHAFGSNITMINYHGDVFEKQSLSSLDEILQYRNQDSVTWVNIEGLDCIDFIEQIGHHFDIHALVLEDILNTHQRPKFEEYENHIYMVLKGFSLDNKNFPVKYEQISILMLDNLVFTFKEKQDDMFAPLFTRIKKNNSRFRGMGADYLVYAIQDLIVDQYFQLQDILDEKLELIEDELLISPSASTLNDIQNMKRELIYIRRSVSPMRELLSDLQRSESPLITKESGVYFRDVYDHVLRVMETVETNRDMVAGLVEMHISSISNKMNEVMKVLTLFASIFIPLTFIAGIYGMNFEYMPELKWKYAYPVLMGFFVVIALSLIVLFKKKKWF